MFNTQISGFYRSFSECLDKMTSDFEDLIEHFAYLKNSKNLYLMRNNHMTKFYRQSENTNNPLVTIKSRIIIDSMIRG